MSARPLVALAAVVLSLVPLLAAVALLALLAYGRGGWALGAAVLLTLTLAHGWCALVDRLASWGRLT